MDQNSDKANDMIGKLKELQDGMMRIMDESGGRTVTATAGGGMVKVTANLKLQLVSVEMEREVVNPDDMEMLGDLIVAAANEALAQAQSEINQEVTKLSTKVRLLGHLDQA
ncbi:MAG: YbaB/EbfC family nucleoid-associated protein [Deltaproteobacteria bacterium]|jgi:DNA-binding YbaB/EbfC family protein|nr:YbaB/EbfC family nucleoid-associated protein [Deltaproteobacteria bacterium]